MHGFLLQADWADCLPDSNSLEVIAAVRRSCPGAGSAGAYRDGGI